jgi:hypothetical protein
VKARRLRSAAQPWSGLQTPGGEGTGPARSRVRGGSARRAASLRPARISAPQPASDHGSRHRCCRPGHKPRQGPEQRRARRRSCPWRAPHPGARLNSPHSAAVGPKYLDALEPSPRQTTVSCGAPISRPASAGLHSPAPPWLSAGIDIGSPPPRRRRSRGLVRTRSVLRPIGAA